MELLLQIIRDAVTCPSDAHIEHSKYAWIYANGPWPAWGTRSCDSLQSHRSYIAHRLYKARTDWLRNDNSPLCEKRVIQRLHLTSKFFHEVLSQHEEFSRNAIFYKQNLFRFRCSTIPRNIPNPTNGTWLTFFKFQSFCDGVNGLVPVHMKSLQNIEVLFYEGTLNRFNHIFNFFYCEDLRRLKITICNVNMSLQTSLDRRLSGVLDMCRKELPERLKARKAAGLALPFQRMKRGRAIEAVHLRTEPNDKCRERELVIESVIKTKLEKFARELEDYILGVCSAEANN